MTFQLLKSRRITASNGATANKLRRAIAALALCGVTASNLFAAEPATLKWKSRSTTTQQKTEAVSVPEPRREAARREETRRITDQNIRLVTTGEIQPVQAQTKSALDDPFGDKPKSSTTQPAAPMPLPGILPPTNSDLPKSGDIQLPGIPPSMQSAQGPGGYLNEPCPKPSDLKPIGQLTNNIAATKGDLPQECTIDDRVEPASNRPWECVNFTWKAAGLCHKPLYFEEQALERYGHSTGPISQPFVSAAHFFGTFPLLPYKMGIRAPWECEYALGYYRPGSCAPYVIDGVPITARAIAAETGAALGLIYILP